MSRQPGFELIQFVDTYNDCARLSGKSCNNYNLAGYVSGQAIQAVKPGGVLNGLSNMPNDLSLGDLIPPLMQQLPAVIQLGKNVAAWAADSALLTLVAKFLLLAVYEEIEDQTTPNPTQVVIPASDFVTSSQAPEATGKECPGQVPNCSNCGGNKNPPLDLAGTVNPNGICAGLPNTKNHFPVDCVCVNPADAPANQPYADAASLTSVLDFLTSVGADADLPPCNNDVSYISQSACGANCAYGTCSPVVAKVRRYEGGPTGPAYYYKCACP